MNHLYRWNDQRGYVQAQKTLVDGAIVLADSDTVLGLLAPVTQTGFNLLDTIKGRQDKPYIILVGSLEQAWQYAQKPAQHATQRLVTCWPGPLTLLLPKRPDSPCFIPEAWQKVALRIPDHEQLRALALTHGGLYSTSANKGGHPAPQSIDQVDADIKAQVGCILLNSKHEHARPIASTIIDCTTDPVSLVRIGAYPIEKIEQIYGRPLSISKKP